MRHLYFKNRFGDYIFIAPNVANGNDAVSKIFADIRKKNPEFTIKRPEIYMDNRGRTCYDVGSKEELYIVF